MSAGISSATNNECSDILFLYMRGSGNTAAGETDANGESREFEGQKEGEKYAETLEDVLPSEIKLRAESLNYPAWRTDPEILWADFDIGLKNSQYWTSKNTGTSMLTNRIMGERIRCPHQQVVISGYSQGAHAVGDALNDLDNSQSEMISFISLFGDPRFNPDSFAAKGTFKYKLYGRSGGVLEKRQEFPEDYKEKMESWCAHNDGFCENRISMLLPGKSSAHSDYPKTGWVQSSATRAANKVTTNFNSEKGLSLESRRQPNINNKIDIAFVFPHSTSWGYNIGKRLRENIDYVLANPVTESSNTRLGIVLAKPYYHLDDYKNRPNEGPLIHASLGSQENFRNQLKNFGHGQTNNSNQSQLSTGLMAAVDNMEWGEQADKHIIVATDSVNNPPDSISGKSFRETITYAKSKGIIVHTIATYPHRNFIPPTNQWIDEVSEENDGLSVAQDDNYVHETFRDILNQIGELPVVSSQNVYYVEKDAYVDISVASSYSPRGDDIASYDWSYGNNGSYDKSTQEPYLKYFNSRSEDHLISVRITDVSGKRSVAQIPIKVLSKEDFEANEPSLPEKVRFDPEIKIEDDDRFFLIRWLFGGDEIAANRTLGDKLFNLLNPDVFANEQAGLPEAYSIHDEDGRLIAVYPASAREAKIPFKIAQQNSRLGAASHTDEASSEIVYVDVPKLQIPNEESQNLEDKIIDSEKSKNKSVLSDVRSVQKVTDAGQDSSTGGEQSVNERKQDSHQKDATSKNQIEKSQNDTKRNEVLASSHFPINTLSVVAIFSGLMISIGLLKKRLS
jgi:hypothetical protein